jgi:Fur family transcriptional regulator, ferric uptake regulator
MNVTDPHLNRLRAQGFRLTPQRLAILESLQQAHRHLTPAEIFHQVSQDMPGLTEATVYRTLNFLAEQGLVLVAHLGHGQLVYEYADHDHHHLICRECGQMRDIDHTELTALYNQFLKNTGYQIDTVHATFFGLCPDCKEENPAGPNTQADE